MPFRLPDSERSVRCLEGYLAYREATGWPAGIDAPLVRQFVAQRLRAVRSIAARTMQVAVLVLVFAGFAQAQDVTVLAVKRVLQAQATTIGPGVVMDTSNRRNKTIAYEFSCSQGGTGSIRAECSIDDGQTFDLVQDTVYTEADNCGPPPNRCLLDIPASCTQIRTPITAVSGCIISSKGYAEQ